MREDSRSTCPISLSLEVFGDRWSLLIIRDIVFAGKRHFREFLASDEHVSTRVLTDRLSTLVAQGILAKSDDPDHKQKAIYSLTEKGIALVPVLAQIGIWGRHFQPASSEASVYAAKLEQGGPPLWRQVMEDLRRVHLPPRGKSRHVKSK